MRRPPVLPPRSTHLAASSGRLAIHASTGCVAVEWARTSFAEFRASHAVLEIGGGPIWDFDHAMGNINRGPAGVVDGFMLGNRHWSDRFHADPAFARAFADRWRELRARGLAESMFADIDRWAAELRTSGAAGRNFDRWRILGVVQPWDAAGAANRKTYGSEVRALKNWLRTRIAWMDAHVDDL